MTDELAFRMDRPPLQNELAPRGPSRNIALVGYTGSRSAAPFDNPEWELWGLNDLWTLPDCDPARFDRWFDLHPDADIRDDPRQTEWLGEGVIPTYVWEPTEDWPATVRFPKDELFKAYQTAYFTNSISYMAAYAITEMAWALDEWKASGDPAHRPTIGVFGIDMATGTEYAAQRPSVEYFLGIAAGAGFNIQIAEESDLLQVGEAYGLSSGPLRKKLNARNRELGERMGQLRGTEGRLRGELEQVVGHINATQGALDATNYIRSVWTVPEVDREANTLPGQMNP